MTTPQLVALLRAAADALEGRPAMTARARRAACAAAVLEVCGPLDGCPWGERWRWRRKAAAHARGLGYSVGEIAGALGLHPSSVSHALAEARREGVA